METGTVFDAKKGVNSREEKNIFPAAVFAAADGAVACPGSKGV